jgi:hypothetical protein
MALFSYRREGETTNDAPVHDPARERVVEHDHHTERTDVVQPVRPIHQTIAAPGAYEVRPSIGSLASRLGLSLLGAGLMVISAFLAWVSTPFEVNGTQISYRVFNPMSESNELGASFVGSAGLVVLILAGLALLGLAVRSGWVTRIAGALGVIAFALFAIRAYRATGQGFWNDLGIGSWLLLGGSVVALIGGFMGTARRVVVEQETTIVHDGRGTGSWAAAS